MSYRISPVLSPSAIPIPGGLHPGKEVIIKGHQIPGADRFQVNFQSDAEEEAGSIPLHFNPRQSMGYVVRNAFYGGWGPEEVEEPEFPFRDDEDFTIRIITFPEYYVVHVNGRHFIDFPHRASFEEVKYLAVGGDAEFHEVIFIDNIQMLPYWGTFPGIDDQFLPGSGVRVRGQVMQGAQRFEINFCNSLDGGDDRPFHFNPRMEDKKVVRNSQIDGGWGDEERDTDEFPFKEGDFFEVTIVASDDCFKCFWGDERVNYSHRIPIENIHNLMIDGNVALTSVEYLVPHLMQVVDIPAVVPIPHGMSEGKCAVIRGFVPDEIDRFHINLQNDPEGNEVGYHFNPRYEDKEVVQNSCLGGWQEEERSKRPRALKQGRPFEVRIMAWDDKFTVYVNGEYFSSYSYRCPLEDIKFLAVDGNALFYEAYIDLPMRQPYVEKISGYMMPGRWLTCRGVLKKEEDANRFQIDLQTGEQCPPESDSIFHFNPRMEDRKVVRGACIGGGWGDEERDQPDWPFKPNEFFEILINVREGGYMTYVNNKPFVWFNHRVDSTQCNHIGMLGDAHFFHIDMV
ncbi:unnamed protein product [Owenia fusiformis]|uniref:Uncharacterized protein n=1 Tax=Owenia fusiformis TaxID=6347 RepID=A0A8J1XXX2_OWEFU|nr:unnamed protein product [Owenia fusiformis]